MKSKTVTALLLLGIGLTSNVFGADAVWYTGYKLNFVSAGPAGGRVQVFMDATSSSVPSVINFKDCPTTWSRTSAEFTLDRNSTYYKEIYTMLMVAYATGKSVDVYTNGECTQYGLKLSDIQLNNRN